MCVNVSTGHRQRAHAHSTLPEAEPQRRSQLSPASVRGWSSHPSPRGGPWQGTSCLSPRPAARVGRLPARKTSGTAQQSRARGRGTRTSDTMAVERVVAMRPADTSHDTPCAARTMMKKFSCSPLLPSGVVLEHGRVSHASTTEMQHSQGAPFHTGGQQ